MRVSPRRIVYVQVHSPRDKFTIEVMDYQHNSKDRSLGLTEFAVEGLVAEGPDAKTQPWVSTGKVAKNDPLKSNGKRTVKGNVEFEAEFFPCAHLKDVSFAPPEASAKITEIAEEKESSPNSSEQSSAAATAAETPANGGSATPSGSGEDKEDEKENEGVTIPREELLKTQTGVLAFQIISGNISKKGARVEVLFDDGYMELSSSAHSASSLTLPSLAGTGPRSRLSARARRTTRGTRLARRSSASSTLAKSSSSSTTARVSVF